MDPHGYKLPVSVMTKLYKMVMNGEITRVGDSHRSEMVERNRFINDLLLLKAGNPRYV